MEKKEEWKDAWWNGNRKSDCHGETIAREGTMSGITIRLRLTTSPRKDEG